MLRHTAGTPRADRIADPDLHRPFAMIGNFRSGELRIDVPLASGARLKLDWRGRSASRSPGVDLQPFLSEVLTAACAAHVSVEMHFEALEYFNSSTVSVLIDFVRNACSQKVPLELTYAGDVRWQRLSFESLKVFASLDHNLHVSPVVLPGGTH